MQPVSKTVRATAEQQQIFFIGNFLFFRSVITVSPLADLVNQLRTYDDGDGTCVPRWLAYDGASMKAITQLLALLAKAKAQYKYTTQNGSIAITRYIGAGGDVIIPRKIRGMPVTSIGGRGFRYRHHRCGWRLGRVTP